MIDLRKMFHGKNLTELDKQILQYIIEHIDTVLQMGVRKVAKANYTSPATVIRLSKKLGYTGFVDMYYQLLPQVKKMEVRPGGRRKDFPEIRPQDFFQYNTMEDIERFIDRVLQLRKKLIFIYATGFSAIAAEYLYKKLLVLGKKTIIASGTDSVGVFENNLEDIGALVAISKSGETQLVIDKLQAAKEHQIFTVSFTKETENRAAELSDLNFKIVDNYELDDRNMLPNIFFPRLLMLFELIFKEYFDRMAPKDG
ncbi:MurR/RpiR family transcriptional regulator [Thermoactinomyces intermedius]|uniref:MurR/RpiR family transcriptional regulator n=1 Tax=Thermoactinomyces intermedius TaxID=2024 RepID=A0A8I1A7S5_THEIN|nr:MurR/RpiR family transcriptional regulator [Thermoactinomyces intermedius]MBH8596003.1 MurR/RpiR family transcriptional regulator [Thermoactinomyces intermedius]